MSVRVAIAVLAMAAFCGLASAAASAQSQTTPAEPPPSPAPLTVAVPLLATPPSMNGVIDESWQPAAKVSLGQDFTYRRPVDETTEVEIAQDASALDVAFVVTQREPRTESQQTNSSAVQSDDYVGVYLFPRGTQSFQYGFFANPRGTRYQTSSENSAYSPQWTAVGHATQSGYVVTLRIPLDVIRSSGSTTWRAQFVRSTVATGGLAVWSYAIHATNANDPTFAGTLTNVGAAHGAVRPKARAQVYGLGEATTPAYGGNTSRMGMDFSLPVTPTASFVGSIHPDYSNVELDQQTISPSAFAYQYNEVRPFFTQAAQAFNDNFSCSDCPQLLYTPSIPTFREGYALEGTQGPVTFGAFDAVGYGRVDQGQAYDYNRISEENYVSANLQHVSVDTASGVHDDLTSLMSGLNNQKTHFFVYLNAAFERGDLVPDPSLGEYWEYGGGYAGPTTTLVLNAQRIGAEFNPPDSYVPQTDLTGWEFFGKHTFTFAKDYFLHDLVVQDFYARYHNRFGQTDQTDATEVVQLDFKNLLTLKLEPNVSAVQTVSGEFLPFDSNELYLGYKINSATPTYVMYAGGPYYHGELDAFKYYTVLPLRRKLNLTLEADEDKYVSIHPGETTTNQWLERATLDWQISRDASFDVGARRVIGTFLPNAIAPPPFAYVNAGNVTVAFHYLSSRNEFYVVYGNPNSLATTPALYVKWIRYIGAPKGT